MASSITRSVGRNGTNLAEDLTVVDDLLSKVGLTAPASNPEDVREAAIRTFQRAYRLPDDGRLDPGGTSLRRLEDLAKGLTLEPIRLKSIGAGGYRIVVRPSLPRTPYRIWVGTAGDADARFEVSGGSGSDVMGAGDLPKLLSWLSERHAWADRKLSVKVFLTVDDGVVMSSGSQELACPVAPITRRLLPLDRGENGNLTYQGDPRAPAFWGRLTYKVEGMDVLFLGYAGRLETEEKHRGFDCITYAGAVCQAPRNKMTDSLTLATALNTSRCYVDIPGARKADASKHIELEAATPDHVRAFFAQNPAGYYLLFSKGHIVVVANGRVYEFAASNGYAETAVAEWLRPYRRMELTVRKLPGRPELAV